MKKKSNKVRKIECPVCTNKRLFDVIVVERAELEIKCQKCGKVINIVFDKEIIKTKVV